MADDTTDTTQPPDAEHGVAAPPAAPPSRRSLRRGVAVVVAIGAVAAIALSVTTVDARTLAAAANAPVALALSLAMVLLAWTAEGLVFGSLCGRLGARDVPRMTGVYLGGSFPSAVTPFASGAIPTWTWLLVREGLGAGEAAAVVGIRAAVTSAFFGLAAIGAAVVLPAVLGPAWGRALLGVLVVLLISIGVLAWVALRPDAVAARLRRLAGWKPFSRAVGADRLGRLEQRLTSETAAFAATLRNAVRRHPARVGLALLATCASRALLFSVPWVLLRGFGQDAGWLTIVLGMLAVQTVGSATPSPGGSGFSEAALAGLLRAQVPAYLIGATVVLWRLLTFWLEMGIGAIIFSRALATPPRGRGA